MTTMQQQHWQQRRAHAPCTCCRIADILRGCNLQTLLWVICDNPTGRARVRAVLFRGATCSLLLPLPSHTHITSHTPKVRRHAVPLRAIQSRAPRRPRHGWWRGILLWRCGLSRCSHPLPPFFLTRVDRVCDGQ